MPSRPPPIFPLTSVRFFLAVWVILFHETRYWGYFVPLVQGRHGPAWPLLPTAYVSVDIFFILSGFVLAYNYSLDLRWTPRDRKRFAIARFSRIYPAYVASLFLYIPLVARGLYKTYTRARAIRLAGVAIMNWSLLQSWTPWTPFSWNHNGWTVSDEAFFYCCFPIIGAYLWRVSRRRSLIAGYLLIWAAALALPLVAVLRGIPDLGDVSGTLEGLVVRTAALLILYHPIARLPEFCAGVLLAKLFASLKQTNTSLIGRGYWLYVPGLALELFVLLEATHLHYVFLNNGLLLPLHALVILGFAFGGGSLDKALSLGWMVFLGDASYTIYIFHGPIKDWMEVLTKKFHLPIGGTATGICYIAFVLVFSCVFYGWVERPTNRYLRTKLGAWIERPRKTAPKESETAPA